MGLPRGRHGTVKDGRRGAATESIALMRSIEVVELQEAVETAIQRRPTREVVPPKDHPPVFGEDGLLQPLDEAVGPGMARLDPGVANAERGTGLIEAGLELAAAVGQHALERPASPADGRQQDLPQEVGDCGVRERGQDAGDTIRARRIAGRDLPDLADALELADVKGVQADQLARSLDVRGQLGHRSRSGLQPARMHAIDPVAFQPAPPAVKHGARDPYLAARRTDADHLRPLNDVQPHSLYALVQGHRSILPKWSLAGGCHSGNDRPDGPLLFGLEVSTLTRPRTA